MYWFASERSWYVPLHGTDDTVPQRYSIGAVHTGDTVPQRYIGKLLEIYVGHLYILSKKVSG